MLLRNLILVGFFYLNLFYLTPITLKKNGVLPFLLAIITAIVVISFVTDWMHMVYERPPMNDFRPGLPPRGPRGFGGPIITSFLVTVMIASVSSSIAFWNDWNKTRELEQERTLQKVASELAILKLQVSPHFLFNTLNNIRWLIRSKSDRAEEAVIKLSQLLRYILYQTNDETVSLEKEVENLRNLIDLQKMRLTNGETVSFEVKGDLTGKMITPLLFIPLVENFFKHGDGGKIALEVIENRLIFKTENTIREKSADLNEDSGIGVENVKKRMALHYPNRHLFVFSQSGNIYKVEMELLL
jgi:LytS/YehU family sensor histidine kinase